MEKTKLLVASLRSLARAAPPGPWKANSSSGYGNPSVHAANGPLFSTGNAKRPRSEALAAVHFVTAVDPATVLALCDLIEGLLELAPPPPRAGCADR